jgi:hypothetical protein
VARWDRRLLAERFCAVVEQAGAPAAPLPRRLAGALR